MIDESRAPRASALVFGGSRGIGAAAVTRLVADGYAVAFTCHVRSRVAWKRPVVDAVIDRTRRGHGTGNRP